MPELTNCPNCNEKIKSSGFKSNNLLSESQANIIKEFTENESDAYCKKCGQIKFEEAVLALESELHKLKLFVEKNLEAIPIVSTHTPHKWNYEILGVVTGQSTTGTGVFSEFTSTFTDLFGVQSKAFNRKIASGEQLAFAQLRLKALDLGGNAIIATDIDYAELGSLKGMIMVCATGTSVKLMNTELLRDSERILNELITKYKRIQYLESLSAN